MDDSSFQLCLSDFFYNPKDNYSYPCFYLDTVSSTQDALKKLLLQGATNKSTVFTYKQTHGRGRNQSQWHTLPGKHLYFSHAQHLKIPNRDIAKLSLLIGMVLRNTLEEHLGIKAKIKWPNDLYIDDKKLSGILCEVSQSNTKNTCIIGIGINIDSESKPVHEEFSPAFAQNYTSKDIHPWQLLGQIVQNIDLHISHIEDSFLKLHQTYSKYDYLLNKIVNVTAGAQNHKGQAKGINRDGALLLKIKDDDRIIPIYSGHIDLK